MLLIMLIVRKKAHTYLRLVTEWNTYLREVDYISPQKAYASYIFRQGIKNALTSLSGSTATHGKRKVLHSVTAAKLERIFGFAKLFYTYFSGNQVHQFENTLIISVLF